MNSFLAAFVTATLASALLTPLVRLLAFRVGAVSKPGGRNVHGRNVPRLGGLAIFFALLMPLVGLLFVPGAVATAFRESMMRAIGVLAGGAVMCAVGLIDDTRRMRAVHKLAAQLVVAAFAFGCGFRIEAVQLPLFGEVSMGVFALPVTVAWIVGIINAINLIDGLDGLAAGVVFFAGLTNFIVAYLTGAVFPAIVMAAMLGAVIGFLFYNFNPARIFMGDSGSYFLGYVLATTGLVGAVQKTSTAVSLVVPILALGVPILDTLFSIVRRFLERRPIFSADRGHLHHRLLDAGLTQRRAVLVLYGVSIVFTVAAIGLALGRSWQAGIAILFATVVIIGLVRFVGYFEYLHLLGRQKARLRSRHAERLRYLMPDAPALFAEARDEASVWAALVEVQRRAELACIELLSGGGPNSEETLHAWLNGAVADPTSMDLVSARFPIGRDDLAVCALRFRWESDWGDVSPQSEVLLQIIIDLLARALVRVRSPHAPRASDPATAVHPAHINALTGTDVPHPAGSVPASAAE